MELLNTIEMLFWYLLAIGAGTLAKEFWHLKTHQGLYKGENGDAGPDDQIKAWWRDRWDDTAFSIAFGMVAAFLFHSMDIDAFLAEHISGMAGVSSEAMAAVFAMSSDWIMSKFQKKAKQKLNED